MIAQTAEAVARRMCGSAQPAKLTGTFAMLVALRIAGLLVRCDASEFERVSLACRGPEA